MERFFDCFFLKKSEKKIFQEIKRIVVKDETVFFLPSEKNQIDSGA